MTFQRDYTINQKAQALIELAFFGTILMLCLAMLLRYGMQANYQQNLQMQAFRKAMKAAYYKTGPASNITLAMVKDKSIPDPQDPWGFAERFSTGAGASVAWDTNMQALYIDGFSESPQNKDLPRQIIEINDTLGLRDSDLADGRINSINQARGAFTTAGYGQSDCVGQIMVVVEPLTQADRLSRWQEHREVYISCGDIKVMNRTSDEEEPGKAFAYAKIDGIKNRITSADLDGDGEAEAIIAVSGTQACDEDTGYCGGISAFKYVDYQRGDIDTKYSAVHPWEWEKDTNRNGLLLDEQQGILGNYWLTKNDNARLRKVEDNNQIVTTTTVNSRQGTIHGLRLNNGVVQFYATTFRPDERTFTWRANK
jgi:hypothetical protein